ncbi:MAG: arsenate reductase/protein-tyrosine-phosphatase family protein, partial [Candidatus Hodarchaeales archaeon]
MNKALEQRKLQIRQKFQTSALFTINFICSGNIIRSPYAHLLFEHLINGELRLRSRIKAESGGVKYRNSSISYESREMLLLKGVSEDKIINFQARYFPDHPDMFKNVDLILVMEKSHINRLPKSVQDRAFLLLEFTQGIMKNVPDPFF